MAEAGRPAPAEAGGGLDSTHDPSRRSWVESSNSGSSEFPIQNLPMCAFRRSGTDLPGGLGVGIGDSVLDLGGAHRDGLLAEAGVAGAACGEPTLNPLLGLGRPAWRSLRAAVSRLLATNADAEARNRASRHLLAISDVELLLPARIGDYTDFYASIHHATNVGGMFRPDEPLLPNYRWLPIGYHGRVSSIRVSGGECRRPWGQTMPAGAETPRFAPSRQLDYEAEVGFLVGPGNPLGVPIPIAAAADHVFGACLLNDWSARDIQPWEYRPLGPFLAKSFATTISPWVVTMDALAPFRVPAASRPLGDPEPLAYLRDGADQSGGGLDIRIEILIQTERMRRAGQPPELLSRVGFADMYWTVAQLLTHHASNGCNLQPGDLLGSGTVSNDDDQAVGSLLELTRQGRRPLQLANGENRGFLEDGDDVIVRGRCDREGAVAIGFGECRARIQPALPPSPAAGS